MCQYVDNTLCWYCPTEFTDDLAPPDAATGKQINFWFGGYFY